MHGNGCVGLIFYECKLENKKVFLVMVARKMRAFKIPLLHFNGNFHDAIQMIFKHIIGLKDVFKCKSMCNQWGSIDLPLLNEG